MTCYSVLHTQFLDLSAYFFVTRISVRNFALVKYRTMKIAETIMHGLTAAVDVFLPRVCVVCGERLLRKENHICLHCLADMPLTHFWEMKCNPMADKFNALIQHGLEKDMEAGAGKRSERYAFAVSLFFYSHEAQYRQILYNLKYEGRTELGAYFGKMLGKRIVTSAAFRDVDCIIPVPLHWARKWKRGYNQAEVIARGISLALGSPLRCDILRRRRRTKTQTKLSVTGKAANVAGAFCVDSAHCSPSIKHILLVDDLFTTGATLHACFTALRAAFPSEVRISVATLGFVG